MDRLTYKDLFRFEQEAFKEEYYYSHTFRRDKDRDEQLEYWQNVLARINRIKETALKKYLEENYLTINDIRFNL